VEKTILEFLTSLNPGVLIVEGNAYSGKTFTMRECLDQAREIWDEKELNVHTLEVNAMTPKSLRTMIELDVIKNADYVFFSFDDFGVETKEIDAINIFMGKSKTNFSQAFKDVIRTFIHDPKIGIAFIVHSASNLLRYLFNDINVQPIIVNMNTEKTRVIHPSLDLFEKGKQDGIVEGILKNFFMSKHRRVIHHLTEIEIQHHPRYKQVYEISSLYILRQVSITKRTFEFVKDRFDYRDYWSEYSREEICIPFEILELFERVFSRINWL